MGGQGHEQVARELGVGWGGDDGGWGADLLFQNLLLAAALFDSVSVSAAVVQVDGSPVRLQLCDTAGQVSPPQIRLRWIPLNVASVVVIPENKGQGV